MCTISAQSGIATIACCVQQKLETILASGATVILTTVLYKITLIQKNK